MKHGILIKVLAVEAALCVTFCLLQTSFTGFFPDTMAFPFEQIGLGLRALSLSGMPGNAVAFAIYCIVGLLPVLALLMLRKKRVLFFEDGLLGLLCPLLFVVLYLMINPGIISIGMIGPVGQMMGKAMLGVTVYSVLCGYFVLRVLRLFFTGGTDSLMRYMSVMLCLLGAVFVFLTFGACFHDLLDSIETLKSGNNGNEHLLGMSYFFLVMQFIVDALPYALNIFVTFAALRLLSEMQADRYSTETIDAANRMCRLCIKVLTVTVLSVIGFNLLQLLLAKSLMVVNSLVQIPVLSIAFVLATLLLTRFVTENKELKDDNDLFV